jgi:NTE family protein
VYDNMGLEPVWDSPAYNTLLVSNGGDTFHPEGVGGWFSRGMRYVELQGRAGQATRTRRLLGLLTSQKRQGAYWGLQTAAESYGVGLPGYSKNAAVALLSRMRTDLDAFSDDERGALMNHGYSLADAAIHTYASRLVTITAPFSFPATFDESSLTRALRGSDMIRFPLGRF